MADAVETARSWWRLFKEALPVLALIGGAYGYWAGYIRTDATGAVEGRYAAREQAQFVASVKEQFAAVMARQDQTDRDRDSRTKIINDRLDAAVAGLRDQIEAMNRDLQQRSANRTEQLNSMSGQIGTLKLKVCVLSGLKVSQCN